MNFTVSEPVGLDPAIGSAAGPPPPLACTPKPSTATEPVILGVTFNDENIKITWDGRDGHLLVEEEIVKAGSQGIRSALENMIREYTEKGVATEELVRQVAKQGLLLRRKLFGSAFGEKVLAEIEERCRVLFHIRSRKIYIPWGLIYGGGGRSYDEEFDSIDRLGVHELKDGFWCSRYLASAIYEGAEDTFGESLHEAVILPGSDLEVHRAFHKEAVRHAGASQPLVSARIFSRNIARAPRAIAYFFGHATGDVLLLHGDEAQQFAESLSAGDLDDELRHTNPVPNRGIFFFNGCNTGVSNISGSWLRVSRRAGFMGFIGTESIVPTKFAWHFGNCFLDLVLTKGRTPLDAMRELREDYWPLSMVYGLYCRAETRVEPPKELEWVRSLSRQERRAVRDGLKGSEQRVKYTFLPFESSGS